MQVPDRTPRLTRRSAESDSATRLRVRVVPRDPERQRLQPASERIGRRWIEDGAQHATRLLDRREPARARRSRHRPVTSLWPFRYFVALCIARSTPSASGCWLMRARERIVDDRQHASRPAGLDHAPDVDAPQRRIGRRLEPDHSRAIADDRLERREFLGETNRVVMPKRASRSCSRCSVPP